MTAKNFGSPDQLIGACQLAALRSSNEALARALRAVVDNRDLCFIPEEDCPAELHNWTERAVALLAQYKEQP